MDQRGAALPEVPHVGHTLTWAELNPKEGVFDFARPKKLLEQAHARGVGVVFRLKSNVVHAVTPWRTEPSVIPEWVLARHRPPTADMAGGDDPTYPNVTIHVAVPWHPGLQREYLRFVQELGRAGIAEHPALHGFYLHGISTSLGEEFWFTKKAYASLAKAGMTPELLESAFSERITKWAQAFGRNSARLAWVGVGWIEAPRSEFRQYAEVGRKLDRLALDEGLGARGGGIETYNQLPPDRGQELDENGYLVTDLAHPLIAGERFYADENEVYDTKQPFAPYAYRSAILRALSMGMSHLWVGEAAELDAPATRFFNLTAARRPSEARDAWVWLREAEVKRRRDSLTIRNFERFLLQREAPGYRTVAASFTERQPFHIDPDAQRKPGDYAARSTDNAKGQERIGFIVDEPFWPKASGPADVTLRVTHLDQRASFYVLYTTPSGTRTSSVLVNQNTGIEHTATFSLPGFRPTRAIDNQFDLALVTEAHDLTVSFVRLSR